MNQDEKLLQMADAEPILQFFVSGHLPEELQKISSPFGELALTTVMNFLPRNPERTVALRKLLESKDAAVRALLYKFPPRWEP
jgi:hypothetical protein